MALFLKTFAKWYIFARDEANDPRTSSWPLVQSPVSVIFILTIYVVGVKHWLPSYMKNRPAYDMRRILVVYNILQIVFNVTVVVQLCKSYHTLDIRCAPMDTSPSGEFFDHSMHFARISWYYYMIKLFDLLDTVACVLRKNLHQVSFLHVYHHVGSTVMGWIGVKYVPGGESMHMALLNSSVHVAMYGYYLFVVLRPEKKAVLAKSKKCVTQLQLLQFVALIAIYTPKLLTACAFPKWPLWVLMPQLLGMVAMFSEFYYRVYIKNVPKSAESTPNNNKTK